jgi:hypothetical protein
VADVSRLPDQQRSALLMRELNGLSYQDLAGALDVTVPAVKSLLVRARIGLVEAAEARDADCCEIRRDLLAAYDRGVKASGRARRHMRECSGCREYRTALRSVRRSFAALIPGAGLGPIAVLANAIGIGSAGGGAAVTAGGGATGAVVAGATACKVAAVVCTAAITAGGAVEVTRLTHQPTVERDARKPAAAKRPAPAAAVAERPATAPIARPRPVAVPSGAGPERRTARRAARRRAAARAAERRRRAERRAPVALVAPVAPVLDTETAAVPGTAPVEARLHGGAMAPDEPVTGADPSGASQAAAGSGAPSPPATDQDAAPAPGPAPSGTGATQPAGAAATTPGRPAPAAGDGPAASATAQPPGSPAAPAAAGGQPGLPSS